MRHKPQFGQLACILGLVLSTTYLGYGYTRSQQAKARATQQLKEEGFVPTQVRATPTLANLRVWRLLAKDAKGNLRIGLLPLHLHQATRFFHLDRPQHPLLYKAMQHDKARLLDWFASGFLSYQVFPQKSHTTVLIHDQRFASLSQPTRPFWGAKVTFDANGHLRSLERTRRSLGKLKPSREIGILWAMIWGR